MCSSRKIMTFDLTPIPPRYLSLKLKPLNDLQDSAPSLGTENLKQSVHTHVHYLPHYVYCNTINNKFLDKLKKFSTRTGRFNFHWSPGNKNKVTKETVFHCNFMWLVSIYDINDKTFMSQLNINLVVHF